MNKQILAVGRKGRQDKDFTVQVTHELPGDVKLLTEAEIEAEANDLEEDMLDREDWARGRW